VARSPCSFVSECFQRFLAQARLSTVSGLRRGRRRACNSDSPWAKSREKTAWSPPRLSRVSALAQSFRKLVRAARRKVRKRPRAGSAFEKASRCIERGQEASGPCPCDSRCRSRAAGRRSRAVSSRLGSGCPAPRPSCASRTRFHEVVGNRFWSPIIWVSLLEGIIFIVSVLAGFTRIPRKIVRSPPHGGHPLGDVERPARVASAISSSWNRRQDLQIDRLLDPQVDVRNPTP
jgi:hypothetical protein